MARFFYGLARFFNDLNALFGGPSTTARRARNKVVGRSIGRSGLWR